MDFISYNNVPMSVAHYSESHYFNYLWRVRTYCFFFLPEGKIIVTVPRRALGIPSTLNYIDANLPVGSSPALRPYPNFEMNELHVRIIIISFAFNFVKIASSVN